MSQNGQHGPKVMVKPGAVADPATQGFQSHEAHKAATAPAPEVDDTPVSGLVDDGGSPVAEKLMEVRVRENVLNMQYGKQRYSLLKGKTALVPASVKRHLEEKGLL